MTRLTLPAFTEKPARWLVHGMARLVRPLTLGVRAVILDDRGRVYLVRHSYVPGWQFPGGGVEPGETIRAAMDREVREEAGLAVEGEVTLHGLFFNVHVSHRDHVAVYVVRSFREIAAQIDDWEIVERGFFDLAALPDGITPATRARLHEVVDGVPPAEMW